MRAKLRAEIAVTDAASLLPHHRRGALFVLAPGLDLLDVAVAIAADDRARVGALIDAGGLRRPGLAELADWCVDAAQRFQFAIVQPYVVAQALPRRAAPSA